MGQYLARQPILDRNLNVIAYELLYRDDEGKGVILDGDHATAQVISQSLLGSDINKIVADKKVYINFTEQIIVNELPLMLDRDRLVIEVLEDVKPTQKVLNALKKIKEMGYTIALDDVGYPLPDQQLLQMADVVKVDFMNIDQVKREQVSSQLKRYPVRMLAEKIETMKEFRDAVKMGYELFQGYFFARPDLVTVREVKPLKVNHIRLLAELNKAEPSYDAMKEIVESDVSLSFKVLKLINSAAYYRSKKIETIKQALTMLGLQPLRKWTAIAMVSGHCEDKPDELFKISLIRAKMIEVLCLKKHPKKRCEEGFLIGILSLIDVMTDRDMTQVIRELPLTDDVVSGLTSRQSIGGQYLSLIEHYEESHMEELESCAKKLGVDIQELPFIYYDALEWTEELVKVT